MTKPRTILTLSLVLVIGVACSPAPPVEITEAVETPPEVAVLEGSSWVAELIVGVPVGEGFESTLSLNADSQAAGHAGCNGYFGSWGTDGDRISFGHLGATMMMCPDDQMAQEQSFMEALNTAERFGLRDTKLFIYSSGADEPTVLRPSEAEAGEATDG